AVTTGAAAAVTDTTATLNGTVNPKGDATTYHFEYGTDATFAVNTTSPDASAGSDFTDHAEHADLTGLTPNTTYHFRIVATNSVGTTNGADKTFTTGFVPCPSCSDFNGDQVPDVLYWNKNTGHTVVWFMGGPGGNTKQSAVNVTPGAEGFPAPIWQPVATGDV